MTYPVPAACNMQRAIPMDKTALLVTITIAAIAALLVFLRLYFGGQAGF